MSAFRPRMSAATENVIAAHRAAGEPFEAGGVRSFVRRQGRGPDVVLMHGVPTSSFLYRRVVGLLADEGLRAHAFDLPGLGLAERPEDFDYSWSGLARWTGDAIEALGISRCHLVVHDIGGPIGLEWAVRHPDRVLSVTALNSIGSPATFRRPWMMRPFARRLLGEAWLAAMLPVPFSELFLRTGVGERSAVSRDEVKAHRALVHWGDRGRAFLRIMRGFELTEDKERLLREGLRDRDFPAQVVWGVGDRAIGPDQRAALERLLGVESSATVELDARHFPQEDRPADVTSAIADIAAPLG